MNSTQERNCPECGGRLIWVVYGYPNNALAAAARRGEVALGGCCVPAAGERWRAAQCGDCGWSLIAERDTGPLD